MWEKVLKLEQILPKQLISRSRKQITELSYAIVLTKQGDLNKAKIFTKRAVQALERELKINKTVKIEENICTSSDPKDKARFKIRMQSLCLAYHHLATIKKSLGDLKSAAELFNLSKSISKKFMKDSKLQKIIENDSEKIVSKPQLFSKRSSNEKNEEEKNLTFDVFGKNKVKKLKSLRRTESLINMAGNLNDNLPSIAQNLHEASFHQKKKSTFKREILEEPSNKLRLVNEISYLRKVENKAAMCIQRFYRGYKVRNRTKNLIKEYIQRMAPENEPSVSEHKPIITIFSYDDNSSAKFDLKSQEFSSVSNKTEEKTLHESSSESSEPDIIVKSKPTKRRTTMTKPSLFDYLNLHSPDLIISQSLQGKIYTWKITIVRKKVINGDLECLFGLFGTYEKFTDTLVYLQSLLIDTNQLDQRFLCPFTFETIWPVIEAELTKDEEKPEEHEFEPTSDETSFTTIKDLANFILSRSGVEFTMTGSRLTEQACEGVLYVRVKDFEQSRHLLAKGGVAKSMTEFAVHEKKEDSGNEKFFHQLESEIIGTVIEKGVVYLKHTFLLLQLKIVKVEKNSKFFSGLQFCISSLTSNWFDDLVLTWEETQSYFLSEDYFLDVHFIFATHKLQSVARQILYSTFSSNFRIHNSKLIFSRSESNEESVFDIFESEDAVLEECHEGWDANFDQSNSVYDTNLDNLCLGVFTSVRLSGEVDLVHLKFSGINKNILIQGKRSTDDSNFQLLVSDTAEVKRISKIFEMGEMVKSVLQYEISIKKGPCGKTLTLERYKHSQIHSSIRKIEDFLYLVTVCVKDDFHISLYNLSNSWELLTSFSKDDLIHYFPQLNTEHSAAINYEEKFVQPLLSGFSLFKGIFGTFSAWVVPQYQEFLVTNTKRIQFFQFTEKKENSAQEIITSKSLFERKICRVLNISKSFLTETIQQEQVLLQRTRMICGLYSLVTVTKLAVMEEWRIYLHIFQNCREFVCKIYNSDMFALRSCAFDVVFEDPSHTVNKSSIQNKVWEIILAQCSFEPHASMDFVFKFDTIITPMRELLYSNHIQNPDFHYFELYIKSSVPFHLKFPTITSIHETGFYIFTVRSYNLQRKLWEKTSLTLKEVLLELLNAGIVNENILLNTLLNYSDLKFFAGALCRILKMKHKENTVQVKLMPELEFSESEEEDYFEEKNEEVHSVSSVLEQDLLLYQEVHRDKYPMVIGVHYNRVADEFAFKAYKPMIGAIFRVPISKKQIFRKIAFGQTLLRENAFLQLGKKIFSEILDRLLKVVK